MNGARNRADSSMTPPPENFRSRPGVEFSRARRLSHEGADAADDSTGATTTWDKRVDALTLPAPDHGPSFDALRPLASRSRRWPAFLTGAISILLVASLAHELLGGGLDALRSALPATTGFYLAFAAIYFVQPFTDYVIFRRLWRLPPAGIVPILRKMVANELLLGYSGEAYFYAWARERLKMVAAPFAAIKDVSILSAVVGNLVTLALLALAAPEAADLLPPGYVRPMVASAATILLLSLAILLFRGRLFSLPRRDLIWVAGVHLLRTIAYTLLLALCWHFALPEAPIGLWLLLVTGRQLVARLPLLPNKDIVFASLALLLVGNDAEVARLVAITVALTLLTHAVVLALTWIPYTRSADA